VYTLGSQRKVSGELSAGYGGFYDGNRTDLSYRGRVELMPQLSLEPGLAFNWIDLSQGETRATLGSVRATYSFSNEMWLAALVQYNSTQSLFSTNLRFKWEFSRGRDGCRRRRARHDGPFPAGSAEPEPGGEGDAAVPGAVRRSESVASTDRPMTTE
jgi:hypothetical protein